MEDIAGDPKRPGKIIFVNDGDQDRDGVPNFADGFNLFDKPDAEAKGPYRDPNAGGQLVPMVLEVRGCGSLDNATITFTYSASNPKDVTRTGSDAEGWEYQAATGALRIWTKNGTDERYKEEVNQEVGGSSGPKGHFVNSGIAYAAADLGLAGDGDVVTLYVEALTVSDSPGDDNHRIDVAVNFGDGQSRSDAVRLTAINIDIAEIVDDTTTELVHDMQQSHPAPRLDVQFDIINPRPSADGTKLIADIDVHGYVRSALCDLTPGDDGKLDEVYVYLNNYETALGDGPLSASHYTVQKFEPNPLSFKRPYEFEGRINAQFTAVEIEPTTNFFRVEATDKLTGFTGYKEWTIEVKATPPPARPPLSDTSDVVVTLTLPETETDPYNLRVRVGTEAQQNGETYEAHLYAVSSAPLMLKTPDAFGGWVVLPDGTETAEFQAVVSVPSLGMGNMVFTLKDTGDGRTFTSGRFRFRLEWPDHPSATGMLFQIFAPDIVHSFPLWGPFTNGEYTYYSSPDGSLALYFEAEPVLAANGVDILTPYVIYTPLGIVDLPVPLYETGADSKVFESFDPIEIHHDESLYGFFFGPTYDVVDGSKTVLSSTDAGGEFHPHLIQYIGADTLLEEMAQNETYNIVKASDGKFYHVDPGTSGGGSGTESGGGGSGLLGTEPGGGGSSGSMRIPTYFAPMAMAGGPPKTDNPITNLDISLSDIVESAKFFSGFCHGFLEGLFTTGKDLLVLCGGIFAGATDGVAALSAATVGGHKDRLRKCKVANFIRVLSDFVLSTKNKTAQEIARIALEIDTRGLSEASSDNVGAALAKVASYIDQFWNEMALLGDYERGQKFGKFIFTVFDTCNPYSKITKAAKLGTVATTMGIAGSNIAQELNMVGKLTASADELNDIKNIANVPSIAGKTNRRLDHAIDAKRILEKRGGKTPHEAYREVDLADPKNVGQQLAEVFSTADKKAYQAAAAATPADLTKVLSVGEINPMILNKKGDLGRNQTYIQVHHVVPEELQELIATRRGMTISPSFKDGSPGLVLPFHEHVPRRGYPPSLHAKMRRIAGEVNLNGSENVEQFADRLRQIYEHPDIGMPDVGKVADQWIKTTFGAP